MGRYNVVFWFSGYQGSVARFETKRQACQAIAEYIREELQSRPRLRPALERAGSAYRDGRVVVSHKSGGREFGAYIAE